MKTRAFEIAEKNVVINKYFTESIKVNYDNYGMKYKSELIQTNSIYYKPFYLLKHK